MSILDRFNPPDVNFKSNINALCFKADSTTEQKEVEIKSTVTVDKTIDDLITDICDLAYSLGLEANIEIKYSTTCRGCGKEIEVEEHFIDALGGINNFDDSYSYCGSSQFCLP